MKLKTKKLLNKILFQLLPVLFCPLFLYSAPIKIEGQLVEVSIELEDSAQSQFTLKSLSGRSYELKVSGNQLDGLKSGDFVVVEGDDASHFNPPYIMVASIEKMDRIKLASFSAGAANKFPSALASTGKMKIAVILVNFPNDTDQTLTPHTANSVMNTQVVPWLETVSYGKLDVEEVKVFGYFTIPVTADCVNNNPIGNMAWWNIQYIAPQIPELSNYNQLIFYTPFRCGGVNGVASIGFGDSTIFGASSFRNSVISHELGHNFGLQHANTLNCNGVSIKSPLSSCSTNEYADPFDVMGNQSNFHYSAHHLNSIGWIAPSEVRTVTANGDYDLHPMQNSASTTKLLQIPAPSTNYAENKYFLEYRQRLGMDTTINSTVLNGVLLRTKADPSYRTSLIDATPETATWSDAALQIGKSFTDPAGTRVTPLSNNASGIRVRVEFNSASSPKTLEFNSASYTVDESTSAIIVYVGRFGSSVGAISVSYNTSNGTALNGPDYTSQSGSLNFDDNDSAPKPIFIPIINDAALESTKNFTVTLSNPSGASLGANSNTLVSITDDDSPGTIRFETSPAQCFENSGNTTVRVLRENGRKGIITLDYSTENLTAMNGAEYTARSGQIVFGDQVNSPKSILIPIIDNDTISTSKIFKINLKSAAGDSNGVNVSLPVILLDNESTSEASNPGGPGASTPGPKNFFSPSQESLVLALPPSQGAEQVKITILDRKGTLIKNLYDGPMSSSAASIVWDGRNEHGEKVVSGIYIAVISRDSHTENKKIAVIR